jgi:nucleoside-diphosphate-sugar epimerase
MVGVNILGTQALLEASAAVGVRVFVNTGSSSEYGFRDDPMSERDRIEPNSPYAIAKAAQSHLCLLAARQSSMTVVVFRLFSVYGPWEEPTRLIPTLLRRARAGLALEMVVPGAARDFVYVDDVLEALLDFPRLLPLSGEVINLGTGIETTLLSLVADVRQLTGSRSEVRWGAMASRRWDTDRWVADPSKAARMIGWRARHDLRSGLTRTALWMEARADGDDGRSARIAG